MKVKRCANEPVRRTPEPSSTYRPNFKIKPPLRKWSIIATLEKGQGERPSNSKRPSYKQEQKPFPVLPPYLYAVKKATALLEKWVKDLVVHFLYVEQLLPADQKDANTVPFVTRRGMIWSNV